MLKNKLLALLLGAVLLFGCSGVKLDLPAAVQPDPTPAPTAAPTPEPTPAGNNLALFPPLATI